MPKITWDQVGQRLFETGVDHVVLYKQTGGAYPKGVAWNGVTEIAENPSGAEASPFYADNIKYLNIMGNEEYASTINAYTYPDEFAECDGSAELMAGVNIKQQVRKPFGYSYRTKLGNDEEGIEYGYKLHLVYGCLASPSERTHASVNENVEPETMSWEVTTTPVEVTGHKPTAVLEIDSTKVDEKALAALEAALYGTDEKEAYLPLPDEVKALMAAAVAA